VDTTTSQSGTELSAVIRFGPFQANRHTGELLKEGIRIKLADQPFQILIALLDRPGELVTREELQRLLWASLSSGNFEQGLNRAVNKLRVALRDSAVNPRYVETLPGHGYRFVGQIEDDQTAAAPTPETGRKRRTRVLILAAAAIAMTVCIGYSIWALVPAPPPTLRWRKLTTDNFGKVAPALSDGGKLYFLANYEGESFVAQIPVRGGHPSRLPITLPGPVVNLQDISRDGQELLLLAGASRDRTRMLPLWTLQIADGTAKRIPGVAATSASYSPVDGTIAYSTETEVWLVPANGARRKLADLKDSFLDSLYWDPAGRTICFSRQNAVTFQTAAWQIRTDGTGLQDVMPQWRETSHSPAGWTPDHQFQLFAADGSFWFRRTGGWRRWFPDETPFPTTNGEPEFSERVRMHANLSFAAVGVDRLGELQRYDAKTQEWRALLDGISAEAAEYSRDGKRVAYLTYPQRTLWVRDADGKRLFYGLNARSTRASVYIRVANLENGQVSKLPGSDGLFAPRWSPRGDVLSALEWQGLRRLVLYRMDQGSWRPLTVGRVAWPVWSADGANIQYRTEDHIAEIRIQDGRSREVVPVRGEEIGGYSRAIGRAPDDAPVRTFNRDGRQLYELYWQ